MGGYLIYIISDLQVKLGNEIKNKSKHINLAYPWHVVNY